MRARFAPFLALSIVSLSLPSRAARPFTPEELLQTRRLDDPAVSPDGKWVAFTVRQKSLADNRDLKDIWLAPLGGGPARQFTRDGRSEHPRWSPDGKQLLAVRGEGPQLWLFDVAGAAEPRQLTALSAGADAGIFSPDGRFIAFTSEVYPGCAGSAAEVDACNRKHEEEQKKSKVSARIIDHLFARHWTEWKEGKRTHVFVQPAAGGPARDLTPGDSDWPSWRLGGGDDFAFSPDGNELVISAKPAAREAWSINGDLFAFSTAPGANQKPRNLTAQNPGDDAQPRFSPDGRYLAFTSQARDGDESDQWKLKLLDRRSGKVTIIGDFDDDVGSIVWRKDSRSLVAGVLHHGRFFLNQVTLDGRVSRFAEAPAGPDFALAGDGSAVFVGSGMNRPPELMQLAQGASGTARKITAFNDEQYKGLDLGPLPEELWVPAKDGSKVHAWVLRPPGLARGQKAPLTVLIHGGPQGAWEDIWGMRWNPAEFAARGSIVLMINPHGSTGYGHAYEAEISGDWGGLAYDDILRAVDAAERRPDVEQGHTCAAGASFGGYMVDWIAGHTDRFRCLVTHDGVFELVSMYGSTEELWFPEHEFGGPYWEKPELYRKWSPSNFAQNFKTPTLVVEGELDFRVPVEQALGMFTALQRKGVESRLLYFPDEGHWVNKPRNSQLWYHTVLDWISSHQRGGGGKVEHADANP